MSRHACPELYPDPRPSRLFAPLAPYLPLLLRLVPWLAAVPPAAAFVALVITALPLVTWVLLSVAVLAPIAAGVALFTFGWES